MAATQQGTTAGDGVTTKGLFGAGLLGGAGAAVANVSLFLGAGAAGVSFAGEYGPGVEALPLPAVVLSSVLPGLPGAGLGLLLRRLDPSKAATRFALTSVVFCVLSFGGPLTVKGLGTGGLVVMELMHVVAAAGIGGMLWRALSRR
ncbi:MAG: hypothetical protein INH41_28950 [Myxococcaceae bacterium]|jgi:hypothetical protein|nr:hypothetical protein [Myxococcaceae bacterium]MCA3016430.1 hypothetical protein [Myxococcaceae bacterium]